MLSNISITTYEAMKKKAGDSNRCQKGTWVAWWRNGYGVGLAIKRSRVPFPVGPLSSYLG